MTRDTVVRDALLALASGDSAALWEPVSAVPTVRGIGDMPADPTVHARQVLETFRGSSGRS
ncbi:hypothetical protein [Microbacterium sp. Se5.02b]|uniref:hypothetical protein n=1 Tax=Microbacterium sp. Se5.02b TaxID=2864103 RepID=UPI001C68F83B|nr:hypothetical protein [Microbacterium sp. Se5.02b]QYM63106.1 hypothetical protein K1X59_12405 [Microbacterium sp. Se5.02b]